MLSVTLSKDWGPHKAGETIEVDDQRAAKLFEDGFARSFRLRQQVDGVGFTSTVNEASAPEGDESA